MSQGRTKLPSRSFFPPPLAEIQPATAGLADLSRIAITNPWRQSAMSMRRETKASPSSYSRHFRTDHHLPLDAVIAIEESGVDLGEFHEQEHENDRAVGLEGH